MGQSAGEHAVEPVHRPSAANRPAGGRPVLLDETTGGTPAKPTPRDDRSMTMLEYGLASVAVVAAFLLAVIR